MDAIFEPHFPSLKNVAQKKTSEPTPVYNCIAWAFGDDKRHWWPNQLRSYWPMDAANLSRLEAFEAWFLADGWQETESPEIEGGYQKVALYAKDGDPTHAARLLQSGVWTSKLGGNIDLSHQLSDLIGPAYGEVLRIYKKPL